MGNERVTYTDWCKLISLTHYTYHILLSMFVLSCSGKQGRESFSFREEFLLFWINFALESNLFVLL